MSDTEFTFETVQPELGTKVTVLSRFKVKTGAVQREVKPPFERPPVRPDRAAEVVPDTRPAPRVPPPVGDPERGIVLQSIERVDAPGNSQTVLTSGPACSTCPIDVVPGEKFESVGIDNRTGQVLQHRPRCCPASGSTPVVRSSTAGRWRPPRPSPARPPRPAPTATSSPRSWAASSISENQATSPQTALDVTLPSASQAHPLPDQSGQNMQSGRRAAERTHGRRTAVIGWAGVRCRLLVFTQFLLPGGGVRGRGTPAAILFRGVVYGLVSSADGRRDHPHLPHPAGRELRPDGHGAAGGALTFEFQLTPASRSRSPSSLGLATAVLVGVTIDLALIRRFFNAPRLVLTVVTIVVAGFLSQTSADIVRRLPFLPPPRHAGTEPRPRSIRRHLPFPGCNFKVGRLPRRLRLPRGVRHRDGDRLPSSGWPPSSASPARAWRCGPWPRTPSGPPCWASRWAACPPSSGAWPGSWPAPVSSSPGAPGPGCGRRVRPRGAAPRPGRRRGGPDALPPHHRGRGRGHLGGDPGLPVLPGRRPAAHRPRSVRGRGRRSAHPAAQGAPGRRRGGQRLVGLRRAAADSPGAARAWRRCATPASP